MKSVSVVVAWIVIKRVLRTPTVGPLDLWMDRRQQSPSRAALHRLQQHSPTCAPRSPTFIHRHDGHICNVKNLQSNRNFSNWGNKCYATFSSPDVMSCTIWMYRTLWLPVPMRSKVYIVRFDTKKEILQPHWAVISYISNLSLLWKPIINIIVNIL